MQMLSRAVRVDWGCVGLLPGAVLGSISSECLSPGCYARVDLTFRSMNIWLLGDEESLECLSGKVLKTREP